MKKMNAKIIIPLVALISLSSCSRILMSLAGMKPPQEETPESVNAYAKKIGLNENNIWILKDSISFVRFMSDTSFSELKGSDMYIFNNKGEYMPYQDPKYTCPAPSFVIANNMCNYSPYNIIKHIKLQEFLPYFKSLSGDQFAVNDISNYDYVVVMNWFIYSGCKNNIDHVVDIQNRLLKNNNCKVKFITPNLDFQKSWGYGKPKISINSRKAKSQKKSKKK